MEARRGSATGCYGGAPPFSGCRHWLGGVRRRRGRCARACRGRAFLAHVIARADAHAGVQVEPGPSRQQCTSPLERRDRHGQPRTSELERHGHQGRRRILR